ncbi:hypothetical protein Neosp_010785 [[Neocosmospora] mangrovei]
MCQTLETAKFLPDCDGCGTYGRGACNDGVTLALQPHADEHKRTFVCESCEAQKVRLKVAQWLSWAQFWEK